MLVRAVAGPSVGRTWRVRIEDRHLVVEATGGVLHASDLGSSELVLVAESREEREELVNAGFWDRLESRSRDGVK